MRNLAIALAILASLASCKKDKNGSGNNNKLADSTIAITRDIYLWYSQIPESFNARSYDGPDDIMKAIQQYSNEPGFSTPVDHWSFAMLKSDWDDVSSGIGGDFGLNVFFLSANDLRVSSVERDAAAGKAGIQRAWRIKQINNISNITTSNADAIVDAVYYSNASTFTFARPNAGDTTIKLNAGTYQERPLALDTVYTTNATKTGYFVFNSFLGDTTAIKNEFNRIFNRFTTDQVKDVIVDLRYNGGGYVALQNLLANYLVPAAGNNQVMLTEQFNDKYTAYNETTRFSKKGNLNLSRLFVIVSQNTASASELLINSLKPYMNVQLIGPSKTHGKPVGFFPIPAEDWYIFPVSFRTVNKNGEGSYFSGMPLNWQASDGLDKPFGDASENCLASALQYIKTGSFARAAINARAGLTEEVQHGNTRLGEPKLKILVDTKRKK